MSTHRPPTPRLHEIRLEIPRGFADFWKIIRELDMSGPWTIAMVTGQTRSHHEVVGRYVRRLAKGGFAEVVNRPDRGGLPPAAHYRLLKNPVDAPRVRPDGSECLPTAQEQMWRAMRSLRQFDARELAFSASTDVVSVSLPAAKSYIARLVAADYLDVVRPGKGGVKGTLAIWRLRPNMNTGPLPPLVMHTRFVWDQNRSVVMAAEPAKEVV
ncbi:Uncharacterised protein [Starkeya nomas]|uniref:Uncharacterized protein n=1 Tax=Starkeya nomas TaxID=2666134 RepID=A0A5S9R6J8_9HYPH|nr:hypothetical protein [Starkeya nomas]CAA0128962.1 Uncharacterised protein [Starkeya nomas]